MQATNFGKLLEMILILILGGQQPKPAQPVPDLRSQIPHDVPLYVEFDPGALVAAGATVPEMKRALAVASSRDGAAATVAEQLGAKPEAVKAAFTGIQRVGVWLLAWGEDDRNFRILIVIQRSDNEPVLPALIEGNTKIPQPDPNARGRRRGGLITTRYNGRTIYGLGGRRGPAVWATEFKGKVAIATDPFALQSLILTGSAPAGPAAGRPAQKQGDAILRAEANGPVALNQLIASFSRHDLYELGLMSTFLDFPSWQQGKLALTKERLTVQVDIEPASKLNRILAQPSEAPALLGALPDDCDLAFILSLKDPNELWSHIRQGFAELARIQGRPERANRLEEEIERELGIDIQKDITENIVAGGVAVPSLKEARDLDRNFVLLGQAKDAAKAEASLNKFLARVARGQGITPMTVGKAKVWSNDDIKTALVGKIAMLGATRRMTLGVDRTLKAATDGTSEMGAVLTKRFPDATSFAIFNPAVLFKGKDVGRLTAGLSFKSSSLKIEVDYSISKLAGAFTEAVEAAILRGKKAQAVNNLRRVAKAAQMYLSDYAKYPGNFEQMLKYASNDKSLFVSPVTDKPYTFNKKVAGLQVGTIPNRGTTVLAHESLTGLRAHGGGHVVYLDGNVEWLESARFRRVVGAE